MARVDVGLARRVVLVGLAVHLLTLPVVTWVLLVVVRETQTNSFVQHVRTFARGVADGFEIAPALGDLNNTRKLLDSVILTGEGVYAELVDNGRSTVSALNHPGISYSGRQDLDFSEHPDATYFIVLPIDKSGHDAEVRLGFDKRPTLDDIARARRRILEVLTSYAALLLAIAVVSVHYLTRPLASLGESARQVASGDHERRLSADTTIREVHDLATDLEKMRAELVGVNAQLRAEMRERERVEAQRQALESQLRRRQRLEALGTLAGGVAHEFNNTLVPIMLFAQSVLDALPPDSPSREDLLGILRSARRSKEVVNKVLTFSRQMNSGKRERLNLTEPVEEVVRLFRALAPASISVVKCIEGRCLPVIADATLINLLTMNLCTNALQAMRAAGGTLTVGLAPLTATGLEPAGVAAGNYMQLRIQDTGHGMDTATMDRIFEPFFTTREAGEGTGLGLAVVHGIVESLDATLLVDSSTGVGTDFRVLFPAAEEQTASQRAEVPHDIF
jgi:signal transduction histidine kinase